MTLDDDKYAHYVEHPRFGCGPRYTGLNPDPMAPDVSLHWRSTSIREIVQRYHALTGESWTYDRTLAALADASQIKRISGTAVIADLTRQSAPTRLVTHYFDLDRSCRDCGKSFIFFAEEQKYWYEVLRFGFEVDCVRCVPCRKCQRVISRNRKRYEALFHISDRSTNETFEMADCCLSLIEASVFTPKQLQVVRRLLNRIPMNPDESTASRRNELACRVRSIERHPA